VFIHELSSVRHKRPHVNILNYINRAKKEKTGHDKIFCRRKNQETEAFQKTDNETACFK